MATAPNSGAQLQLLKKAHMQEIFGDHCRGGGYPGGGGEWQGSPSRMALLAMGANGRLQFMYNILHVPCIKPEQAGPASRDVPVSTATWQFEQSPVFLSPKAMSSMPICQ